MSVAEMPKQETKHSIEEEAQEVTPFQVLKVKVYPVINGVILKLIDHIVKSQEVEKHEERLKKKKLLDELQRKYMEREVEKEELGSDYEESDDEEYYKKLQMSEQVVQALIHKRISRGRKASKEDAERDSEEELGENVFNPIQFIIDELRQYQADKRALAVEAEREKS